MPKKNRNPESNSESTPAHVPQAMLQRRLMRVLSARKYQPLNLQQLQNELRLEGALQAPFTALVAELLEKGVLVELRHRGGIALAGTADLVSGSISFTRSGSAFVDTGEPRGSVFIPAHETFTAMHGDKVLVRLAPKRVQGRREGDLPEGRVIRIVERRRQTLVGTLQKRSHTLYVQPMQSSFPKDIIVPDCGPAQVGDRVLVRLEPWDNPSLNPEGQVVESIGPAQDASLDTQAVLRAFDIAEGFSPAVMQEAATAAVTEADCVGRVDLRRQLVFTIDPETAKDYDDAISLERLPGGRWRLGVHIADVAHFVRPDTPVDAEAYRRGTSVYLPDKVVPMLPEQLSNGLCSLQADVDRLCFSAFMTLSDEGEVQDATFAETVIRSRHRLTYGQVLAVLEAGRAATAAVPALPEDLVRALVQVHRLAQKLRRQRVAAGALMLNVAEVKIKIGPDGRIADVVPQHDDISHQLVEECMLLANEQVCKYLAQKGRAQLYRIHAEPDPEKLAELADMFETAGLPPEDFTDRMRLARFLTRIKDMPAAGAWNTNVLRAMKRAEYSTKKVGHYGLAKEFYAHFTSPIRRYPDLVTHRLLKACLLRARSPYTPERIQEMAAHCSQREQLASEAERECIQLKLVRFFREQLESHDVRDYDAVVVDVRNMGLFVDIPAVQTGGLIKISELGEDFFDFDEARQRLRGRRSAKTYEIGSRLKVIIARVDEARKRLDFVPVPDAAGAARPRSAAAHGGGRPSRLEGRGGAADRGSRPGPGQTRGNDRRRRRR